MQLEQPMPRSTFDAIKVVPNINHNDVVIKNKLLSSGTVHDIVDGSQPSDDDDDTSDARCSDSFVTNTAIDDMGIPASGCAEDKLSWLRSQVIGYDQAFVSPFGERRITYADHTATGRSLHCIERFITDGVLPSYGNTHTGDSYVGQWTTNKLHEAAEYLKRCMGGSQDDALLFCGSGTTAAVKRLQEVMGLAVSSKLKERVLRSLGNEERWVVFVGPYEHHSNLLSWRQSLAEVVEVGLDENGLLDMEALRCHLQSYRLTNRPMLGSISACSNVTGICSDARALARLLHHFGAFACFDFAASGPYLDIDMRSGEIDGYDAIFLSPHKFLGGPGSPGILLMKKALYQLGSSPPSTCGGGTVDFANGFSEKDTVYFEDVEERENAGTPPIIQTIRAALAFWVKKYVGYGEIKTREQNYIRRALERLLPNPNIVILGNTSAKRLAILSFLIYSTTHSSKSDGGEGKQLNMWAETGSKRGKPLPGPFVAKLLNDLFGVQARGGCACAGPYGHSLLNIDGPRSVSFRQHVQKGYSGVKPGWTRVSFPYYMDEKEHEFILTALEFVSIYGQRFLPLYHFNWKTGNWTINKAALKETLVHGNALGWSFNQPRSLAPSGRDLQNTTSNTTKSEDQKFSDTANKEAAGMVNKYGEYLETAKQIAGLLPKCPPQRQIPDDIEPDLLYFRV